MKRLVLLLAVFASAPLAAQNSGDDFISLLRSMEPLFQQVKQYSKEGKTVKAERLAKEGAEKIKAYADANNGFSIPAACPTMVPITILSIDGGQLDCFRPHIVLIQWDYRYLDDRPDVRERIEDKPQRRCRDGLGNCRPVTGHFDLNRDYSVPVSITMTGVIIRVVPVRIE